MWWLLTSLAFAGFGDGVTDQQASMISMLGFGPAFRDRVAPNLGVGLSFAESDLFQSIDPSLRLPRSTSPTLVFGGFGTGPGTFSAEVQFHAGGREKHVGDLSTSAPAMFWASYFSGGNLISLFGAKDPPIGFGPAVGLHAGLQGPLRIGLDKVGELKAMELAHFQIGPSAFAYVQAPPGFALLGHVTWMPGYNSFLTMGKFDGAGRFALGDPDIFVPIERFGEMMAGLIEAENHFQYRHSWVVGGRLVLGPVVFGYHLRDVRYHPKPGSGLDPNLGFHLATHVFSVGAGGYLLGGE